MKSFLLTLFALLALSNSAFGTQCSGNPVIIPVDWITMTPGCRETLALQIQMEVGASIQYLAMGAHFSRDSINRPGFAKLFFDASSEEREHALKLIEYMLMRGELTSNVTSLITVNPPETKTWKNGVDALEHALKLETGVTNHIKKVIIKCEHDPEANEQNNNDYHLVDYLTGEFLEEQYKGQRDLAGKASTLKKMMALHSSLGEFIFDKKLLGIDI